MSVAVGCGGERKGQVVIEMWMKAKRRVPTSVSRAFGGLRARAVARMGVMRSDRPYLSLLVVALVGSALVWAPPKVAHAGPPSIQSLQFVTVYAGPAPVGPLANQNCKVNPTNQVVCVKDVLAGAGTTDIDVDGDADFELRGNASLSVKTDLTTSPPSVTVSGLLQFSRIGDAGGLIGLSRIPLRAEAAAILGSGLNDDNPDNDVRRNVSLGYDSLSTYAPEDFKVDLNGCETLEEPCKTQTPRPCPSGQTSCQGTETTLTVNVTYPPGLTPSLKLVGELSKQPDANSLPTTGRREAATRGEIDFKPIPGASSPLTFTIWNAETKDGPNDPVVPTLNRFQMSGNKEQTQATAHLCRLTESTYVPKEPTHTACDAAGYADQSYPSRIIDAMIDPVPRESGGNSFLAVTVEDNDLGPNGGVQRVRYDASPMQVKPAITVTDVLTHWENQTRHERSTTYNLRGVPTWMQLDIQDDTGLANDATVKSLQTIRYTAGGRLDAVGMNLVDREDGVVIREDNLGLVDVPTELAVLRKQTEGPVTTEVDSSSYPTSETITVGSLTGGFICVPVYACPLYPLTTPIDEVVYSTADGQRPAGPPVLEPTHAFVFTTNAGGVRYTKVRARGVQKGQLTIEKIFQHNPFETPSDTSRLELISLSNAKLSSTPLLVSAEEEPGGTQINVNDLPPDLTLFKYEPRKTELEYEGSAIINSIFVKAHNPQGLFEPGDVRATSLAVDVHSIPKHVQLNLPDETNKDIDFKVLCPGRADTACPASDRGEVQELVVRSPSNYDPSSYLDSTDDGLILTDIRNATIPTDDFTLYARARGLRSVGYADYVHSRNSSDQLETATKEFNLDTTQGRRFVARIEGTEDLNSYTIKGDHWSDSDFTCTSKVEATRTEVTNVVIGSLPANANLLYHDRHAIGDRECYERYHANDDDVDKFSKQELDYSADTPGGGVDFWRNSDQTHFRVGVDRLPTVLQFCLHLGGRHCQPDFAPPEADLGTFRLWASDYLRLNVTDCKAELSADGYCGTGDLELAVRDIGVKRFDFWGDDGAFGEDDDIWFNTADFSIDPKGAVTFGSDNPFRIRATGEGFLFMPRLVDFSFADGWFARDAHIEWFGPDDLVTSWVSTKEEGGGRIHCPEGPPGHTYWLVFDENYTNSWVESTGDWCTFGTGDHHHLTVL